LPMPLNGGGMLIRADVLQAHMDVALQEDGSDERIFALTLYLAGYKNYNTGESYAIHKVGTTKGGMHQLYRDAVAGEGVTVEPPTRFGPEHPYLRGEIRTMSQYAGNGLGSTRFKTLPSLTPAAHALHKRNNQRLLAGEPTEAP
jgi:hypothetical protein